MPNYEYLKGARAERELVILARAAGYEATRSAGSKGPYDVTVADASHRWLVNVKWGQWAGPAERKALTPYLSEWTTGVLARRTRAKWSYRRVDKDGSMGLIENKAPWEMRGPIPIVDK